MSDNTKAVIGSAAFLTLAGGYFYLIAKAVVIAVEGAAGMVF